MSVATRMEEVRKLGKGTMPILVRFNTEKELEEAQDWLKGKRKVSNLSVAMADKRPLQDRIEEIAASTLLEEPKKKKGKKKK